MATRYIEEYATEADFLAACPDAPGKLGLASIDGEYVVANKSGSVIELVDETRTQTLTNKTLTSPTITGAVITQPTSTPTGAGAVVAGGGVVFLNAAAGFALTLPAVAAGLRVRFIVGAVFATTNFTIVTASSANVIQGGAIVNSVYVPAVDEDTISFVASAETIGDYVELNCDGTNWLCEGVGALAGSITFTVAS